jgi:hypothetical protein
VLPNCWKLVCGSSCIESKSIVLTAKAGALLNILRDIECKKCIVWDSVYDFI